MVGIFQISVPQIKFHSIVSDFRAVSQGTVFLSAYHASTKVVKFTGKNQKSQLIILKAETIRKCFFEQALFILEVAQHDGNSNQIYFRRIQKDTHV